MPSDCRSVFVGGLPWKEGAGQGGSREVSIEHIVVHVCKPTLSGPEGEFVLKQG
jgi:hypothetical protein